MNPVSDHFSLLSGKSRGDRSELEGAQKTLIQKRKTARKMPN